MIVLNSISKFTAIEFILVITFVISKKKKTSTLLIVFDFSLLLLVPFSCWFPSSFLFQFHLMLGRYKTRNEKEKTTVLFYDS